MVSALSNDWSVLGTFTASNPVAIEAMCATIASIMGVNPDEVGLLKVRGMSLEFVYPFALKAAGRIPLSSSAVAARTATLKRPDVFNDFFNVTHNSVFELVPLGSSRNTNNPQHIQKLMSFPVLDRTHKSIGVIQISRKGRTRDEAGPDFTEDDIANLDRVTQAISCAFERL